MSLRVRGLMIKTKTGRNAPCPCGSGKKYKRCCWLKDSLTNKEQLDLMFKRLEAKQKQIIKQQGFGKKIISEVLDDKRFIFVGNKAYWDDKNKWVTFYDFLLHYGR